ncbi:MAG: DUF2029 domain-containing protein, partial [Gaiellaceae bacterium]|nr:DUF2029 domain-containing protein [Gaiellaceae bacterium]
MAFVALAVPWVVAFLVVAAVSDNLGWDLRHAYLPAAASVRGGESPYPALADPILEEQKGYVYPPQLAVVLAPFAHVPDEILASAVVGTLLLLAFLTLWLLDVRDPRCYAASFASLPVLSAASFANVSLPLALALALAWRYRERAGSGLALGLAVSAKLVLWPLLVWMVGRRRWSTALVAGLSGVIVTVAAWATIGFQGLREYPALLRRLSEIQAEQSYSLLGVSATLGLPSTVGRLAALAAAASLLFACFRFARWGDDLRSFTSAVLATLAASPIVWLHYLVVLFVPLAAARPRFSALWLVPLTLVLSPRPGYAEGVEVLVPLGVVVVLGAVLL